MDEVRTKGGESLIFSSMHESGKRESSDSLCSMECSMEGAPMLMVRRDTTPELNQLTGVCAILNFPLDIEVGPWHVCLRRVNRVDQLSVSTSGRRAGRA